MCLAKRAFCKKCGQEVTITLVERCRHWQREDGRCQREILGSGYTSRCNKCNPQEGLHYSGNGPDHPLAAGRGIRFGHSFLKKSAPRPDGYMYNAPQSNEQEWEERLQLRAMQEEFKKAEKASDKAAKNSPKSRGERSRASSLGKLGNVFSPRAQPLEVSAPTNVKHELSGGNYRNVDEAYAALERLTRPRVSERPAERTLPQALGHLANSFFDDEESVIDYGFEERRFDSPAVPKRRRSHRANRESVISLENFADAAALAGIPMNDALGGFSFSRRPPPLRPVAPDSSETLRSPPSPKHHRRSLSSTWKDSQTRRERPSSAPHEHSRTRPTSSGRHAREPESVDRGEVQRSGWLRMFR